MMRGPGSGIDFFAAPVDVAATIGTRPTAAQDLAETPGSLAFWHRGPAFRARLSWRTYTDQKNPKYRYNEANDASKHASNDPVL
jgi:hypothetical protein